MITIDERKQKWLDLYEGKVRTVVLIETISEKRPNQSSADDTKSFIEWSVRNYRIRMDNLSWLDDDMVPYISALTGTEIFAGAFGCPVHYPDDNMPYARPLIFNSKEMAKVRKPVLENSSLMKLFELGQKLHAAAPEALIQLPDIQSPLDIAALIWEKGDFFMAMYDEPQAVKDLISMVHALLTEFLDLWFKTFGKSFISHYPWYYMPYGITLSEDEIGSINTDLFREFSWQSLCDLSARYGNMIGIHCCAKAKHQWKLLKEIPGLMLLNLGQPDQIIRDASRYFKDGPPIWADMRQNECHDFRSRAVLHGKAGNRQEALDELQRLREYSEQFRAAV